MKDSDELDELFSRLRETPPEADPANTAPGFETRVLACVRATRNNSGATWYWRWSIVFGAAAIICAGIFVHDYLTLSDPSIVALDDDDMMTIISLF